MCAAALGERLKGLVVRDAGLLRGRMVDGNVKQFWRLRDVFDLVCVWLGFRV